MYKIRTPENTKRKQDGKLDEGERKYYCRAPKLAHYMEGDKKTRINPNRAALSNARELFYHRRSTVGFFFSTYPRKFKLQKLYRLRRKTKNLTENFQIFMPKIDFRLKQAFWKFNVILNLGQIIKKCLYKCASKNL